MLTLFPAIVESFFQNSLMKRAIERSLISYQIINLRDFGKGPYKACDDIPYGGGAGMVMLAEPVSQALLQLKGKKRVIFPTPSGCSFSQKKAYELSEEEHLVFICGRYEGLDQRVIDLYVDDEISIGDYVLSSGEVSSLVIIDSVYRLVDGVIKAHSLEEESFSQGLLEYPQYTRPRVFSELLVPDVLLSGNHEKIHQWRLEQSKTKTKENRPDLWKIYEEKLKE